MDKTINPQTRRHWHTSIVVLVVVVIIVFGVSVVFKKPSAEQASPAPAASPTTSPTPVATSPTAQATTQTFKDGTYKATGSYDSPGGTEGLTVTLTLQNGVVSSSLVQSGANDPTAAQFQGYFIQGYKPLVVGKKITDVHLSHVSGSSLTSQGFNAALKNIEQQAQS